MSNGFSFDFIQSSETGTQNLENSANTTTQSHHDGTTSLETPSFCWYDDLEAKFSEALTSDIVSDQILLSQSHICRVRKNSSVSQGLRNLDLVPGVYEGGLKVWECSVDLCRYLEESNAAVNGHVLELGCGQGLPGCWVLKRAFQQQSTQHGHVDGVEQPMGQFAGMVFSDFNEFVLHDVTIPNILLNVRGESLSKKIDWLGRHVALGFGDWNDMSDRILSNSSEHPSAVPSDGKFDLILAAETTYSSTAASDTARLIVKHLKVDAGVAFVATKRYYFGVGGGSDAFKTALASASTPRENFEVETIMVYDNGAGNIRELLRVRNVC